MPTLQQRPGRTAPRPVVLVLACAVLAGCTLGPPDAPPSAPLVPSPAAGPSDAALCGPKVFGAEQPEDAWVPFDVTREQVQVIERRLVRVLCRGGLWRKGVGFGVNFDQERGSWFVMIHPGFSGLTARQILDRLLGV
jgi:hypothetical protein